MDSTTITEDSDLTSSQYAKRQRAKQACEPCRLRKRRCDGAMPCNMCKQFEYKCYFEKHARKRSKLVEQNAHHETSSDYVRPEPPQEDRSTVEDTFKTRNMEANSGMAFVRLLGQRLDPTSGAKLSRFGWNLGTACYVPPAQTPITDFLNQDQMYDLAQLHFKHVHLLYGFLDKDHINQKISQRWAQPDLCTVPDHLLANLAAVGSLFSDGSLDPLIPAIVESAKRALESTSTMTTPTIHDVQSWLLRCLYLRATDHPHACHMVTCISMHLIEAIGLHEECSNTILHPSGKETCQSVEIRRRTFWVARMINTWVSFECGRTRVTLRGITTQLPTPKEGDHTVDYLNLYSLSCFLDPERSESQWEDFLRQLDEYEAKHVGIALSKANLGLAAYRRIRLINPNPSADIINRIIKLGLAGLDAARSASDKGEPWWHVANIPFQAICIFLAMDVRESLVHIATAMRALEAVANRFPTVAMKEALQTARFLVRLSKRRKDEDAEVLEQSLKKDGVDGETLPEPLKVETVQLPAENGHFQIPHMQTPMTVSSDDWSLDLSNHSQFDWNFFLTADMPTFNSFAPDGTM